MLALVSVRGPQPAMARTHRTPETPGSPLSGVSLFYCPIARAAARSVFDIG